MNALKIDVLITTRVPFCSYCGISDDETGSPMYKFGTRDAGEVYFSEPMCSVECHDEAFHRPED